VVVCVWGGVCFFVSELACKCVFVLVCVCCVCLYGLFCLCVCVVIVIVCVSLWVRACMCVCLCFLWECVGLLAGACVCVCVCACTKKRARKSKSFYAYHPTIRRWTWNLRTKICARVSSTTIYNVKLNRFVRYDTISHAFFNELLFRAMWKCF